MRLLSLSINVSFTPHTVMAQTDMAHKQPIRTRLPPIFPANPVTPPCTHTPLVLCAHSACGLAAGVCSLKHIEIPTLSGVQGSHSIASELSLTFRAECGMQKLSVRSSRRSALFLFILVAAGIDSRARVTSLPPPTPHPAPPNRPPAHANLRIRFWTRQTLTQFRGGGITPAGNDMRSGSGSTGASRNPPSPFGPGLWYTVKKRVSAMLAWMKRNSGEGGDDY